MKKCLAALFSTLALVGCNDGSTSLIIENQSLVRLESIQARGPGFAAYVGDLAPGERRMIKICPQSEAGLGLTFSANSREFKSPVSGYFESGYEVSAIISKNMTVAVDAEF